MGFQEYFTPLRPLTLTAIFLWFLIVILLIAATGGPSFVQENLNLGAFQVCPKGVSCFSIDTDCQYLVMGYTAQLPGTCSQFQAFRAFLLLGLLLAIGVSILTFVVYFTRRTEERLSWLLMNGLMGAVQFCLLVSFSVFSSYFSSTFPDSSSKGDSFNIEVAAWCFGFVAWGLWDVGCWLERPRGAGWSFGGEGESMAVRIKPAPAPTTAPITVTAGGAEEPPVYKIPSPEHATPV